MVPLLSLFLLPLAHASMKPFGGGQQSKDKVAPPPPLLSSAGTGFLPPPNGRLRQPPPEAQQSPDLDYYDALAREEEEKRRTTTKTPDLQSGRELVHLMTVLSANVDPVPMPIASNASKVKTQKPKAKNNDPPTVDLETYDDDRVAVGRQDEASDSDSSEERKTPASGKGAKSRNGPPMTVVVLDGPDAGVREVDAAPEPGLVEVDGETGGKTQVDGEAKTQGGGRMGRPPRAKIARMAN